MNSDNLTPYQPKSNYWSPLTDLVEESAQTIKHVDASETNKKPWVWNKEKNSSDKSKGAAVGTAHSEVRRTVNRGHSTNSKVLRDFAKSVDELEKKISTKEEEN